MKRRYWLAMAFLWFPISLFGSNPLQITITQGKVEPIKIAMMDIHGTDSYLIQLGKEISSTIETDLSGSGLFRPLKRQSFLQKALSINENLNLLIGGLSKLKQWLLGLSPRIPQAKNLELRLLSTMLTPKDFWGKWRSLIVKFVD